MLALSEPPAPVPVRAQIRTRRPMWRQTQLVQQQIMPHQTPEPPAPVRLAQWRPAPSRQRQTPEQPV